MSALVRVCNKQDEVWVELISFQHRQDALAHVRHGGLFDPMSGTLQPLALQHEVGTMAEQRQARLLLHLLLS